MIAELEKLAAHLENLDSGSGEAKQIRWAIAEIERLRDQVSRLEIEAARLSANPGLG